MKINVDFQVYDSGDPKVFIVIDTSEWAHIENKPTIIEIISPGFDKPVVNYFDQMKVNVFNSHNLGLRCFDCQGGENADLPDGIYDITLKGSPETFNKNRKYLRTTSIQLELDELLLDLTSDCGDIKDSNLFKKYQEIQMLLRASEANIRHNNICVAQNLLLKAQELIRDSKCGKC